jgi:predicted TIM-barrel fold metal-dependent hydrolase
MTKIQLEVPANACDCHMHIYDNSLAGAADTAEAAELNYPVSKYRPIQRHVGTTRTVVVTPKVYGTDNGRTLNAISQLGAHVTRGVAVVHPGVSDAELKSLHDGGIRGIRFSVGKPAIAATTTAMIEPLANRVKDLGWHIELHMLAQQIVDNERLLRRISAPIVFDHMGRLPRTAGIKHAAFEIICQLLENGRTWIKLTGAVFPERPGQPGNYNALAEVASAYIGIAPERMVWGSDWPHLLEIESMPDDRKLFELVASWTEDEAVRKRIWVDNPQALYDFPASRDK